MGGARPGRRRVVQPRSEESWITSDTTFRQSFREFYSPRTPAARAALLRKTSALLDAAGVRLEDFVLADEDAGALEDLVGSGEFDAVVICALMGW